MEAAGSISRYLRNQAHCSVLRSAPGEANGAGTWPTWSFYCSQVSCEPELGKSWSEQRARTTRKPKTRCAKSRRATRNWRDGPSNAFARQKWRSPAAGFCARRVTGAIDQTRTLQRPLSFADEPGQRGFSQTSGITLTSACRCNNSPGHDFAQSLRSAGVVKLVAGSV
jgi:hypothetical protein